MAALLRQIVASPRARHSETGLDLCYVTDHIIATSGPSSVWPKKAYRNPLDQLVKFLDYKHQSDWSIFEFRAEGTGYPDSEVYNRIHHFPWPDHHPPPFAIIPPLLAAMRNWIQGGGLDHEKSSDERKRRVAVVHCKAGKGRSGTIACSYLISEEGWKMDDALQRFTERRMRVGFGTGVSIPSQLRWVGYVDRWANQMKKRYIERPVEIVEIHVWGLREGVKVSVESYVDNGRRIKCFHTFKNDEKIIMDEGGTSLSRSTHLKSPSSTNSLPNYDNQPVSSPPPPAPRASPTTSTTVLLKPSHPLTLPTSDININFERRASSTAPAAWPTMLTSLAHVWFNAYFEGGHEQNRDSGVFEIDWDALDGIKGSVRKGVKALDQLKVVWRYARAQSETETERLVTEPRPGEHVTELDPPHWRGDVAADPQGKEGSAAALGVGMGGVLTSSPSTVQVLAGHLGVEDR